MSGTLYVGNDPVAMTGEEFESYDSIMHDPSTPFFGPIQLQVTDGGTFDLSRQFAWAGTPSPYSAGSTDSITLSDNDTTFTGSAASDTITGGAGDDVIYGGAGNDTIIDNGGTTVHIYGGDGSDGVSLGFTPVSGVLDGGAGIDGLFVQGDLSLNTVAVSNFEQVVVFGTIHGSASQIQAILPVVDSSFPHDSGFAYDLALDSGIGGQTLDVSSFTKGFDITVSDGGTTVSTGSGNDLITVSGGNDTINAGGGDDTIAIAGGGNGSTFDGGTGTNTLHLVTTNAIGSTGDLDNVTNVQILQVDQGSDVYASTANGLATLNAMTSISGDSGALIRVSVQNLTGGTIDLSSSLTQGADLYLSADDGLTIKTGSYDDTVTEDTTQTREPDSTQLSTLDTGAGNDTLVLATAEYSGLSFNFTYHGGDGTDTLKIDSLFSSIDLTGATLDSVERLTETPYAQELVALTLAQTAAFQSIDVGGLAISGTGTLDLSSSLQSTTGSTRVEIGTGVNLTTGSQAEIIFSEGGNVIHAGGGDDTIYAGNGDQVYGEAGNDTIDVGIGDKVDGGAGNDTFVLSSYYYTGHEPAATIGGGDGDDTLQVMSNADLRGLTLSGVETLATSSYAMITTPIAQLTSFAHIVSLDPDVGVFVSPTDSGLLDLRSQLHTASGVDQSIYVFMTPGSAGSHIILGNGNDEIVSAGGSNIFEGGGGSDNYVLSSPGDIVVEQPGGGDYDHVFAPFTYTLTANVEQLTLEGTGNITGIGNALNNTIWGNDGNNGLFGGLGADTMIGAGGNDIYWVDNPGDVVIENPNEGIDFVHSTISYTLPDNVERLQLDGTAAINATGNALDNLLFGNAGDNILDGRAGADVMNGGAGNDTYYVDNAHDVVIELANGGTDTVHTTITYTLAANVENGVIDGSNDLTLIGNALANVLTGNAGNNGLYGGAGADTMIGGAGNDIYWVDNAGDLVVERASEGIDLVHSMISYTLTDNVERLILDGSANINGTGNALDNIITGNAGDNVLTGGLGADVFVFGTAIGHDTVTDFAAGTVTSHDYLQFSHAMFASFADVMAHAQQVGADTVITYDANDAVTLQNVTMASLVASDFQFV